MRGSDVVDLLFDLLPRTWVQVGLFALFVIMAVTGWYEPVIWYVFDKATGIAEQVTPVVQKMFAQIAAQ